MSDDDPDLFEYAHARMTDPITSHEAVPKNLTKQASRVLIGYEPGDAILDHEAYRRVGLGINRLAHQRCSDLRAAGFIERTGERARTPSNNTGYLCRITDAGREYLAKHKAEIVREYL